MTHVRTHQVENRLATAMSAPGGVSAAEAVKRAEQAVEEVRGACMEALDAKIAEIDVATALETFSASAADMARVYTLANEILSEAGAFGLMELSEAGLSLCELTAHWRKGGADVAPVRVHVAAMKALRREDVAADQTLRANVLDGLRKVTAKIAAARVG
jgi:hypothetical protein